MVSKQTKPSNAEPGQIDYAALPSNILEIAGDFQIAWVKEKPLPRPEPVGFYSERYPDGDGYDYDD